MSPTSLCTRLTLLAVLSATTFDFLYKSRRRLKPLKQLVLNPNPRKGKLFFITQTGTSKALAQRLLNLLSSNNLLFDLVDPQNYEPEDLPKDSLSLLPRGKMETRLKTQNSSSIGSPKSAPTFAPGICYSPIVNLPSLEWEAGFTVKHLMR